MRIEEYSGKKRSKVFDYNISGGLLSERNTHGRSIIEMKNISPRAYPCVESRRPYFIWEIENAISSLGSIDGVVYYTRDKIFYYGGHLMSSVSSGSKVFLNFNSRVLIFPDKKCFDPKTKKMIDLVSEKTMVVQFISSDLGVNAIKCGSGNVILTDHFYAGQGILISGSGNSIVDGYHYITGVDKTNGVLYFNNYEFGSAAISSCTCTVSNEIPDMDSVCICQNRVWGVKGNKVYASRVGDPKAFCAFNRKEDSSYVGEYFDTDGFTYIMEYEGSPLIFSNSAIYKVYGDNSDNYDIGVVCRGGGILADDTNSVAEVRGEVYYVSHGKVVKFTGVKSIPIESFPYDYVKSACGAARGGIYYISYSDQYMENFFLSYDTASDTWYKQGELWISKMITVKDALYGLSSIEAYLIDFDGDDPMDSEYEGRVESYVELDDVFYMGHSICPETLILRADVESDSTLEVKISYDGAFSWKNAGEINGERHGIIKLMLPQKRCDSFRLRIVGVGSYCIKNASVECSVI